MLDDFDIDLLSYAGLPKLSDDEKKSRERLWSKIDEYRNHFGEVFAYGNLDMSTEDIIRNIDKCIKHNRKWYGYIVPIEDFSDPDIYY